MSLCADNWPYDFHDAIPHSFFHEFHGIDMDRAAVELAFQNRFSSIYSDLSNCTNKRQIPHQTAVSAIFDKFLHQELMPNTKQNHIDFWLQSYQNQLYVLLPKCCDKYPSKILIRLLQIPWVQGQGMLTCTVYWENSLLSTSLFRSSVGNLVLICSSFWLWMLTHQSRSKWFFFNLQMTMIKNNEVKKSTIRRIWRTQKHNLCQYVRTVLF